ncbi:hypothetical protein CANCADRAFT_148611 [Tortispora caseinolytica NRRL Y-17796]|uniref:methionyl-tRNA formyltransferase n=1 Tax=Tortispora caseinolytica NRRL Y-17796 TaxID=767744 RepID=A0A1E4TDF0_9ASCO|nr:hypothetical protein CANCADRAFT_148611 [Tortispora caseinolytica NRRL Y-17796]
MTVCSPVRLRRLFSSGHTARFRVLFFGTSSFAVPSLEALCAAGCDLTLVTRSPKRTGRGNKQLKVSATEESGIVKDVVYIDKPSEFVKLRGVYDLIVAVSYGMFIPPQIIDSSRFGGLNAHPSILPRHQGTSPIQYTILNRDPVTGVSVQTLDPHEFDKGQVLKYSDLVSVADRESSVSLAEKLVQPAATVLSETVVGIERTNSLTVSAEQESENERILGEYKLRMQLTDISSKTKKVTAESAKADFSKPAEHLDAQYRAFGKLWGAKQDGSRVLLEVEGCDTLGEEHAPGTFFVDEGNVYIKAGVGSVKVARIKPEGKPFVDAQNLYAKIGSLW